jgi:hypothetical protein
LFFSGEEELEADKMIMEEVELNYRNLRKIQEMEKNSPVLIELNSDFYSELQNYIEKLEVRFESETSSHKQALLKEKIGATKKIGCNIRNRRVKKILILAGSQIPPDDLDLKNLITCEKYLLDSIYKNIIINNKIISNFYDEDAIEIKNSFVDWEAYKKKSEDNDPLELNHRFRMWTVYNGKIEQIQNLTTLDIYICYSEYYGALKSFNEAFAENHRLEKVIEDKNILIEEKIKIITKLNNKIIELEKIKNLDPSKNIDKKICSSCKLEKPYTEFYRKKGTKDNLQPMCIPCRTQYLKNYRNLDKSLIKKVCRRCTLAKPKTEFSKNQRWCKECFKNYRIELIKRKKNIDKSTTKNNYIIESQQSHKIQKGNSINSETIKTRICDCCKLEKPVIDFYKFKKNKFSWAYKRCIDCNRKYQRAYSKSRKDQIKAQQKAYHESHKDQRRAQQKAYCESHKDQLKAQKKAYYESHKDQLKAQKKAYYESHKDQVKAYQKAYQKAYRESHKDQLKAYRESHKDQLKAQKKAYRESHKDQLKAQKKAYRESHKDQLKAQQKANLILEPKNKYIIEPQQSQSEIKISDATKPDSIPLTDSSSVFEDKIDDKFKFKKNWPFFRIKSKKDGGK